MSLKLNLACGTDIKDGWVNLDIVPKWPLAPRGCDKIWDARKDKIPFNDGSVSEVYAGYLFLHLAPHFHLCVIQDIFRVLSPGGSLMVGEVDMEIVMKKFLDSPTDGRIHELIWGEQGILSYDSGVEEEQLNLADYDKHCHGFTEPTLRDFLVRAGFKNINRTRVHHQDVFYELTLTCNK